MAFVKLVLPACLCLLWVYFVVVFVCLCRVGWLVSLFSYLGNFFSCGSRKRNLATLKTVKIYVPGISAAFSDMMRYLVLT